MDAHFIGKIQLETAIDLYNQENYICAITLARAAEEYLGKKLPNELRATTEFKTYLKEALGREIDINLFSNKLKHFDPQFSYNSYFIGDINRVKIEEHILLCRALANFYNLTQTLSDKMISFVEHSNEHVVNITSFTKQHAYAPANINIGSISSSVSHRPSSVTSVVKNRDGIKNTKVDINTLTGKVVDCAIQVHKKLGPGLLESAYQHAMAYMMARAHIPFVKEKKISVQIDDRHLDEGYRADFIIADSIILEIKSVEKLVPIHDAQILAYMRLGKFPIGLLMNFNEHLLKNGLKRFKL